MKNPGIVVAAALFLSEGASGVCARFHLRRVEDANVMLSDDVVTAVTEFSTSSDASSANSEITPAAKEHQLSPSGPSSSSGDIIPLFSVPAMSSVDEAQDVSSVLPFVEVEISSDSEGFSKNLMATVINPGGSGFHEVRELDQVAHPWFRTKPIRGNIYGYMQQPRFPNHLNPRARWSSGPLSMYFTPSDFARLAR
ncbi:hypothetical protein ON010_g5585 [Phytophthora cinnamomi]|nr:hypothetical protein ON010_g5585 [Phytophthora cinnamomi]